MKKEITLSTNYINMLNIVLESAISFYEASGMTEDDCKELNYCIKLKNKINS